MSDQPQTLLHTIVLFYTDRAKSLHGGQIFDPGATADIPESGIEMTLSRPVTPAADNSDMGTQSRNMHPRSATVVNLLEYKARRGQVGSAGTDVVAPPTRRAPWLLPTPRQITHWRQMLTHLRATDAPS